MNNKQVYEHIMKNVSKIVKKHINEYEDYSHDDMDDDINDYYDEYDEDHENSTGLTFADELAYHFGDEALSDYGYDEDAEEEEDFYVDDDLNESADDIYDDDQIFMFDEDKEDDIESDFYDNHGNWDPVKDYPEFDSDTDEGHIYDVAAGVEYIDFTKTSPVHLNDADMDIIGIQPNDDNFSVTLFDPDNDAYDLSDFTDNDIKLIIDAVDNYLDTI